MEQESSESGSSFYFNKSKKKGEKVYSEECRDKLSKIINSFMKTQAQNEISFFKKLFGEKSSVESVDDDKIVEEVQNLVSFFFIDIRFNVKKVIINYSERVRNERKNLFRHNKKSRCSHSK